MGNIGHDSLNIRALAVLAARLRNRIIGLEEVGTNLTALLTTVFVDRHVKPYAMVPDSWTES